jgi:predicted RNase H-like HicB family nuclease
MCTSHVLGAEGVSVPVRRPIKPAYVRAFVRLVDRPEASMIPGVPYRFTIRPLPKDERGGYLIEFPDLPELHVGRGDNRGAIASGLDAMRGATPAMGAEEHPIPASA